ncbi:MAG: hypothetical protein DRN06_02400, partial [Thermoprotei archaeon]
MQRGDGGRRGGNAVSLERVKAAIEGGVKWLEGVQRRDGSWGRFWEVWNTANAAFALAVVGVESEALEKAINFLLESQLESGGFFYENFPASRADIRERADLYCIETAAVALMALYEYEGRITPEIQRGLHFLVERQRACGGWELPFLGEPEVVDPKLNYFPSVTGYALRALLIGDPPESVLERGLEFLERTQRRDGSWGRSRCYYNTEAYAIRNVVSVAAALERRALPEGLRRRARRLSERALSYALRHQNADGSWSAISIATKELATALYLQSLLAAGVGGSAVFKAVDWLLKRQQKGGFWSGGYYGRLMHPNLGYIDEV